MKKLIFCALFFMWVSVCLADDVGQFKQIINQVNHLRRGQATKTAKVSDIVANKDMVRTEESSRAELGFIDDTKMTIGPKTELTIEEYMYDTKTGKRQSFTNVYKGVVETVVLHVVPADQFVTRTPTATAGIRD